MGAGRPAGSCGCPSVLPASCSPPSSRQPRPQPPSTPQRESQAHPLSAPHNNVFDADDNSLVTYTWHAGCMSSTQVSRKSINSSSKRSYRFLFQARAESLYTRINIYVWGIALFPERQGASRIWNDENRKTYEKSTLHGKLSMQEERDAGDLHNKTHRNAQTPQDRRFKDDILKNP